MSEETKKFYTTGEEIEVFLKNEKTEFISTPAKVLQVFNENNYLVELEHGKTENVLRLENQPLPDFQKISYFI